MIVLLSLKSFEYFETRTIKEAVSLLGKYGGEAKVIAGGTLLVPQLKARDIEPKYIIDISGIKDLDYIEDDEENLRIGAVTTYRSLEKSSIVLKRATALAGAVREIGNPQTRNLGTIGGNLISASPAADTVPPLIVLEACLKLKNQKNERLIPIEDFFISKRRLRAKRTILQDDELLTEIQIPHQPSNTGSAFIKIGRKFSHDYSIASAAVALTMEKDICKSIRIALGAVAPTYVRARITEDFFREKLLDEQIIEEASKIVVKEIHPNSNIRASAEYKVDLSKVLIRNAIKMAINNRI